MKLPIWPKIKGSRDIKLGLSRVLKLLDRIDNPHLKLPPTIHISGTNGKGSTLAYLDAIIQDAGYTTHKYTSPHLIDFNERIMLCGEMISDKYLNKIIDECKEAAELNPKIDITFFEGITVAAFLAFSRVRADILLLETGMGGRLDATNVIKNPILTIISSISMDHTEFLGDSLVKIATEKAGIIKENSPVITSRQKEEVLKVISNKCNEFRNSPFLFFGKHFDYKIQNNEIYLNVGNKDFLLPTPKLNGEHQIENACLAVASLQAQDKFTITSQNIISGLKNVKWQARIEKITNGRLYKKLPSNFELYVDGCHNEESSKALSSWIIKENIYLVSQGYKKPATYIICSILKDKDSSSFFKYLSGSIDFAVMVPIENNSRVEKSTILAKKATNMGIKATYSDDFEQAFEYIKTIHGSSNPKISNLNLFKILFSKKKNAARVIICGSLFLAGEFLEENNSLL